MKLSSALLFLLSAVFACANAAYVSVPGGRKVWSDCLHRVPKHSHIIETPEQTTVVFPDGTRQLMPKCPKPSVRAAPKSGLNQKLRDSPDDGWQVWSAYNNAGNKTFDQFLGTFNVPQNPADWQGGILYFFTGLQNDNWVPIPNEWDAPYDFEIIQPVIQYGDGSANGGGDWYGLASWFVTLTGGAYWSDLEHCNSGDSIFGNMTRLSSQTWFIGGTINGGVDTSLTVSSYRFVNQPWAYCTLELYNIESCSSLPPSGSTQVYQNLQLFSNKVPVTPKWQALDNGADHCDTSIKIASPSSVVITF